MASTMRRRSPPPMLALPWATARTWRWRAPAVAGDDKQYPAESVLRLRLQRGRRADRGRGALSPHGRAALADDRGGRDGAFFCVGHREFASPAKREALRKSVGARKPTL